VNERASLDERPLSDLFADAAKKRGRRKRKNPPQTGGLLLVKEERPRTVVLDCQIAVERKAFPEGEEKKDSKREPFPFLIACRAQANFASVCGGGERGGEKTSLSGRELIHLTG